MGASFPRFAVAVLALAAAVSACGSGSSTVDPSQSFIAFPRDFAGFEDWEPFSFEANEASGNTHLSGPRTVYLNHRPPKGSTRFPVGTILVKVIHPHGADEQIFAMAKRGGEFNKEGAAGWEWFELKRSTTDTPIFMWRGIGPPAGESYSQVDTGCNVCHSAAAENDFVRSGPLSLGDL